MTPERFWVAMALFHLAGALASRRVVAGWCVPACQRSTGTWSAALARDVKVDLVLAGHTHGGQVVIPFFGPPCTASRLPRLYAGDLHRYEGIPLHVSRGIGMERAFTVPVRFLCPPEICILDVRLPAASADRRAMILPAEAR